MGLTKNEQNSKLAGSLTVLQCAGDYQAQSTQLIKAAVPVTTIAVFLCCKMSVCSAYTCLLLNLTEKGCALLSLVF
jgi:hypothetical protein